MVLLRLSNCILRLGLAVFLLMKFKKTENKTDTFFWGVLAAAEFIIVGVGIYALCMLF